MTDHISLQLPMPRIHCDHCGWEKAIPIDDADSWAGKNCPRCGTGPMVTQADCDEPKALHVRARHNTDFLNDLIGAMAGPAQQGPGSEPMPVTVAARVHIGNGAAKVEDIKVPAPAATSLNGHKLTTMRGPLDVAHFPYGLSMALEKFDRLRAQTLAETGGYAGCDTAATDKDLGPQLNRLARGMQRLTYRGVRQVTARESDLCAVYTRQNLEAFTCLSGLFNWDDGIGRVRRKLLLLAWRKGASTR